MLLERLSVRDPATARHSGAVSRYARELCRGAGGGPQAQELVHHAGLLHDVGKLAFPDHILFSRRRLAPRDWDIIRGHPEEGARLIEQMDGRREVVEAVLCHHERVDGRGYPEGRMADAIPPCARMISVADTYDVMTARDSYRKPERPQEAIDELRRVAGTQLDGDLVELFVELVDHGRMTFCHLDDADYHTELALDVGVLRPGLAVAG